ncbi:MAG: ABC transporter permease [Terriglobia bacterium]
MAIPLKYNIRNLIVRRTTTLMTALSITLTVGVFVILMALAGGLQAALTATGNPLNVLVMREGSQSEVVSFISHENYQIIRYLHGIATDKSGNPMADPEEIILIAMKRIGQQQGSNVTIRGVGPDGVALRSEFHLVAGRMFRPGMREVVVSKQLAGRFQDCSLGDKIKFAKGYWTVVGVFEAGHSAYNSEIWTNVDDLAADFDRPDYSEVVVKAKDAAAVHEIEQEAKNDRRLHLKTETELAYYQSQTSAAAPIKAFGIFIAVLMAIGASFAAMNTMYAAVARRTKEIGTLRAVGFSRRSILASFVLESVVIAFVGGLIGCLLSLPVNLITTGTMNFSTFSEITFNFNVTPQLFVTGVGFAVLMGLFGGFFPAWRASHENIVTALRA